MPSYRNKPGDKGNFQKRRTFEQGKKEIDAAHIATQQLYCDALEFWRKCRLRVCQRHRRCGGQPTNYIMQNFKAVLQTERLRAEQEVIAGGKRRSPPATHIEWTVRPQRIEHAGQMGIRVRRALLTFPPLR